MTEKEKTTTLDKHWKLVHAITNLCLEALDTEEMYSEDVYIALERVKWHWMTDHVEIRIEERFNKTCEYNLQPYEPTESEKPKAKLEIVKNGADTTNGDSK